MKPISEQFYFIPFGKIRKDLLKLNFKITSQYISMSFSLKCFQSQFLELSKPRTLIFLIKQFPVFIDLNHPLYLIEFESN